MDVIVGVNAIEVSRFDGEDVVGFGVGFEGALEWYLLREPKAVSNSAFLTLALLAISPYKEVNSWTRSLDGRSVFIACMAADSPAITLETIRLSAAGCPPRRLELW